MSDDVPPCSPAWSGTCLRPGGGPPRPRRGRRAFNLTLALIDADGRHTDDELWGVLGAFARRNTDTQLSAADAGRRAHGRAGERLKQAWLDHPSVLFDLIVGPTRRSGPRTRGRTTTGAIALGFLVCSLDALPSEDELQALERWRGLLVDTMRRAEKDRPAGATPLLPATPVHPPRHRARRPAVTPAPRAPRHPPPSFPTRPPIRPSRSRSCWPSSTRSSAWRR